MMVLGFGGRPQGGRFLGYYDDEDEEDADYPGIVFENVQMNQRLQQRRAEALAMEEEERRMHNRRLEEEMLMRRQIQIQIENDEQEERNAQKMIREAQIQGMLEADERDAREAMVRMARAHEAERKETEAALVEEEERLRKELQIRQKRNRILQMEIERKEEKRREEQRKEERQKLLEAARREAKTALANSMERIDELKMAQDREAAELMRMQEEQQTEEARINGLQLEYQARRNDVQARTEAELRKAKDRKRAMQCKLKEEAMKRKDHGKEIAEELKRMEQEFKQEYERISNIQQKEEMHMQRMESGKAELKAKAKSIQQRRESLVKIEEALQQERDQVSALQKKCENVSRLQSENERSAHGMKARPEASQPIADAPFRFARPEEITATIQQPQQQPREENFQQFRCRQQLRMLIQPEGSLSLAIQHVVDIDHATGMNYQDRIQELRRRLAQSLIEDQDDIDELHELITTFEKDVETFLSKRQQGNTVAPFDPNWPSVSERDKAKNLLKKRISGQLEPLVKQVGNKVAKVGKVLQRRIQRLQEDLDNPTVPTPSLYPVADRIQAEARAALQAPEPDNNMMGRSCLKILLEFLKNRGNNPQIDKLLLMKIEESLDIWDQLDATQHQKLVEQTREEELRLSRMELAKNGRLQVQHNENVDHNISIYYKLRKKIQETQRAVATAEGLENRRIRFREYRALAAERSRLLEQIRAVQPDFEQQLEPTGHQDSNDSGASSQEICQRGAEPQKRSNEELKPLVARVKKLQMLLKELQENLCKFQQRSGSSDKDYQQTLFEMMKERDYMLKMLHSAEELALKNGATEQQLREHGPQLQLTEDDIMAASLEAVELSNKVETERELLFRESLETKGSHVQQSSSRKRDVQQQQPGPEGSSGQTSSPMSRANKLPPTTDFDKLKENVAELRMRKIDIDEHFRNNQENLEAQERYIGALEEDLEALENQQDTFQERAQEIEEQQRELQREMDRLREESARAEEERNRIRVRVRDRRTSTHEFEMTRIRLSAQRENLTLEIEKLENTLNEMKQQHKEKNEPEVSEVTIIEETESDSEVTIVDDSPEPGPSTSRGNQGQQSSCLGGQHAMSRDLEDMMKQASQQGMEQAVRQFMQNLLAQQKRNRETESENSNGENKEDSGESSGKKGIDEDKED